jgi:hypothetical protein
MTVFGVDVSYAIGGEFRVASRKRIFAGAEGVGWIPNNHEVLIRNQVQDAPGFGRGTHVARVFVLKTDDHVLSFA